MRFVHGNLFLILTIESGARIADHGWTFGSLDHPIGSIYRLYTGYILPSRGLYNPCHLLPEPEQSIDLTSEETFGV